MCERDGHEQPDERPDQSAGHDADCRAGEEGHDHADGGPDDRGGQFASPGDEPRRQPDHGRGEDDVDTQPRRIGDLAAQDHAAQRREVPRDEHEADGAQPVPAFVGPTEPSEVRDGEGECFVGQEVRHHAAPCHWNVAQPRAHRRRIEHVPGVEQRREDQDRRPGDPARDVPDRRELGRAGEGDRAHRHRVDDREAGIACRETVHEAEPDPGDDDAQPIGDEPTAIHRGLVAGRDRCGAQRRNVFAQVPSHTT